MKRYRKRMQQQIGMCIQDITAPLLQRCSQLAAAGEDTDKRTNDILDDAHNFVAQLADIYDYVSPRTFRISVIFTLVHKFVMDLCR